MKFTRTLLLVFAVALILPLILNVKNSEAKTGIRRFELFGGIMFMSGYKIAKRYQKNYYTYCKKKLNIENSKVEFDMPMNVNSINLKNYRFGTPFSSQYDRFINSNINFFR